MFVGHYSASFAAKAFAPRAPLWVLLLAAQLVDVVWVILVLGGVELVRLDPSLASNPLDLAHMPYTHSLLATLLWAGLAGVVVARTSRLGGAGAAAAAAGAAVLSHWLLDFLVHRPDMTLWPGSVKLGLALWDRPVWAQILELGLLWGSVGLAVGRGALTGRAATRGWIAAAALTVLQLSLLVGPLPASIPLLVSGIGITFLLVAAGGAWVERPAVGSEA